MHACSLYEGDTDRVPCPLVCLLKPSFWPPEEVLHSCFEFPTDEADSDPDQHRHNRNLKGPQTVGACHRCDPTYVQSHGVGGASVCVCVCHLPLSMLLLQLFPW